MRRVVSDGADVPASGPPNGETSDDDIDPGRPATDVCPGIAEIAGPAGVRGMSVAASDDSFCAASFAARACIIARSSRRVSGCPSTGETVGSAGESCLCGAAGVCGTEETVCAGVVFARSSETPWPA
jgi:hypothetical protein